MTTLCTHRTGGWVDARFGLYVMQKSPWEESNSDASIQTVARHIIKTVFTDHPRLQEYKKQHLKLLVLMFYIFSYFSNFNFFPKYLEEWRCPTYYPPSVGFHFIITIRYRIKEIVHKIPFPIDYPPLTYPPFSNDKHTLVVEPKNYASNGGMCKP